MKGILLGLALLIGAAFGASGAIAVTGATLIATVINRRRSLWMAALVAMSMLGVVRVYEPSSQFDVFGVVEGSRFVGSVDSRPIDDGQRQMFALLVNGSAGDVRLCVWAPVAPSVSHRDRVRAVGDATWFDETDVDFQAYLRSRSCAGTLFSSGVDVLERGGGLVAAFDSVRRRINAAIQRAAPGDAGVLLSGLATGDDVALSDKPRDAFIVTGTSHITAVSGSNLALLVTIFAFAGSVLRVGKRWWWLVLIAAGLWLYVAIIGVSPPPLRAALVATLALIAAGSGRKPDFITLSVLVAAIEVLARPEDFEQLAFRLSTVSSIALVLALAGRVPTTWRGAIMGSVAATAATQAATGVFLMPLFGRFALYAIPANLVIAPLCALAFPLALLSGLAGLVSADLAAAVAAPASWLAAIVIAVVERFAGLPGADAGASIGGDLHPLWWGLFALVAVVALSKECQGGLRRVADEVIAGDLAKRRMLSAAAAGSLLGAIAGALAR